MAHPTTSLPAQTNQPIGDHNTLYERLIQCQLSDPPPPLSLHTTPALSITSCTATATAQYSLPTGGVLMLHISFSKSPPCESRTAISEHVSDLPDGFLVDLNPQLLNLSEKYAPRLASAALGCVAKLSRRYARIAFRNQKLLVEERADNNETSSAGVVVDTKDMAEVAEMVSARRAESGLSGERMRLVREAELLSDGQTRREGFVCGPKEDDLLRWEVKLFFDDAEECSLGRELRTLGRECVELELLFSEEVLQYGPLIRLVAPYLVGGDVVGGGGGVFVGEFSKAGWTPVYTVSKICEVVRMVLVGSGVRMDEECIGGVVNYTEEGAREDVAFMEERFMTSLKFGEREPQ